MNTHQLTNLHQFQTHHKVEQCATKHITHNHHMTYLPDGPTFCVYYTHVKHVYKNTKYYCLHVI